MGTAQVQEVAQLVLGRLAEGASLAEVLGLVVEGAERETLGACLISLEGPEGRIRYASATPIPEDVVVEVEAGRVPGAEVRWEAIRDRARALGVFLMVGGQQPEQISAWALLSGIAIERKRREDETRARESQIGSVMEAVLDGIITIDHRGIVESFNRAAEKLFGYTAAEVIGRNVSMLMSAADAHQHDAYLHRYLTTGKKRIIGIGREVVGKRKSGDLVPIDLGVSEFRVGNARKFTGMIHDLTARKKLEAELLRSQKLEAIGTLAAGVAHDFNNLLMGIAGCASIALNKLPADSPSRVYLDEAKAACERGGQLTRQLLAFSRRAPSEMRPMSLNDAVLGTEIMAARLIGAKVELVTELAVSAGTILGDLAQIEQILINLVVNARDAMDAGGTVTVRTRDVNLPRGQYACLEVEDVGCGMDGATQARMFEPFYTTKGPDRGTGLGLSTVFGIVEQHRGFIEVESELGRGTTVSVFFPRIDASTSDA